MPYVRTVRTAFAATALQVVHSSQRGSREIEPLGPAHDEAEPEVLKAAAQQRLLCRACWIWARTLGSGPAVPPSVCIRQVNSVVIAQEGYRASPRHRTRRSGRGSPASASPCGP